MIKGTKRTKHILQFAIDSDKIEGEEFCMAHHRALVHIINVKDLTEQALLDAHRMFSDEEWAGKYRTVMVTVGKHVPPAPHMVKLLMSNWSLDLHKMDSFEAHNRFEKIHPFFDGNGRMGRAIWLRKALAEGYNFEISFLHSYYYATLAHIK